MRYGLSKEPREPRETHLVKALTYCTKEIPQDIIDSVIAAVGDSDDTRLLKKCSLVSSSFLLPSCKQLFSRITLSSDQTCQRIHQFLVQNPVLQSSVRAITLTEYIPNRGPDWINGTTLPAILRLPFCCPEYFSMSVSPEYLNHKPWEWKSLSSELKDALSNIIIHSSNLKTLSLFGITEVPITFFLQIVHLTTLELNSILPSDFDCENSSSPTQAASKGVTPMASHTAIDRCVWHYRREYTREEFIDLESIFLPFMCRLRFFEINVDFDFAFTPDFNVLYFLMSSLCISLTSPATLEHLKFNFQFRRVYGFRYYDLNNSHTFCEVLRDADAWSQLDSITTHPTGSRLQRVDISIDYLNDDGEEPDANESDRDSVLKAVLDGLPLLRAKGILFVEVILVG